MSRQRIALVTVALATVTQAFAAPGVARAHVAPNPTENNRYVKATLLPDRVRFSYTIFYGERPGAGERQRMDRDGDGAISPAESAAFGRAVRDDVAAHVRLVVDGQALPPAALTVEDVGLGTPVTTGGAFSVDLVLVAPTHGAGAHALRLEDSWIVPEAGEHELFVDESPGVRLVAAHLASAPQARMQIRWSFRGNPAVGERTVEAQWNVDEAAYREVAATSATSAAATTAAPAASRRVLWIALGAAALGGVALYALTRRRRS
jgi:hypothetical protein